MLDQTSLTPQIIGQVPIVIPKGPEHAESSLSVATQRVLHVINGEHYSGAERVQDLLGLQLPQFGFEVGFACVKPDRFPTTRQSAQSRLYRTPMLGKLDFDCA